MVSVATAGVADVIAGGDVVVVVEFSPTPALLEFPAVEPADAIVSSEVDDVLPPDVLVVLVVVVALLLAPPSALLAFPAVEFVASRRSACASCTHSQFRCHIRMNLTIIRYFISLFYTCELLWS